jgi:hypothetical protein
MLARDNEHLAATPTGLFLGADTVERARAGYNSIIKSP